MGDRVGLSRGIIHKNCFKPWFKGWYGRKWWSSRLLRCILLSAHSMYRRWVFVNHSCFCVWLISHVYYFISNPFVSHGNSSIKNIGTTLMMECITSALWCVLVEQNMLDVGNGARLQLLSDFISRKVHGFAWLHFNQVNAHTESSGLRQPWSSFYSCHWSYRAEWDTKGSLEIKPHPVHINWVWICPSATSWSTQQNQTSDPSPVCEHQLGDLYALLLHALHTSICF